MDRREETSAVMFMDVSDSTAMYAHRGDRAAFEVMDACLAAIEGAVRTAGGRVVKRLGDAVLAVAPSPSQAVEAMRAASAALAAGDSTLAREGIQVRAGISHGSVVLSGGDVYGDVVNVAARLVSLAKPGEILLSDAARDALPAALCESTRPIDPLQLRGRPSRTTVYRWVETVEDMTRVATRAGGRGGTLLEVRYGDRRFLLDPGRGRIRVGRAEDNDIVIADEVVSRYHATLALTEEHFRLTDRSTNGTFVRTAAGERLHVLRNQVTLAGSGQIFAGSERLPPIDFTVRAGGADGSDGSD